MAKLIFINLPVSDLARATAFYEAITLLPQTSADGLLGPFAFLSLSFRYALCHDRKQ
jgi:predicted enzyme related to lactoylglutathione lyase